MDTILQLSTKYPNQIAQLEADGVNIKNKRLLMNLLEKTNGQVDEVKQLLARKAQKNASSNMAEGCDEAASSFKPRHAVDVDDLDHLRALRSAGGTW